MQYAPSKGHTRGHICCLQASLLRTLLLQTCTSTSIHALLSSASEVASILTQLFHGQLWQCCGICWAQLVAIMQSIQMIVNLAVDLSAKQAYAAPAIELMLFLTCCSLKEAASVGTLCSAQKLITP